MENGRLSSLWKKVDLLIFFKLKFGAMIVVVILIMEKDLGLFSLWKRLF